LETDADVSYQGIVEEVEDLGLIVRSWDAPLLEVAAEQQRPERQGLFGALSVGFAAAAVLTALGFLLYAFFSFRRRFVELGVLRAIGLSPRQMTAFLAWELGFLVAIGLGAGTGLGVVLTNFFVPYLQVGSGTTSQIPPYIVRISWSAVFRNYALFGVLFVVALIVLIFLLMRIRIFQAIKMGETA
jgi:putative ABC transport system permease protein